MKLSESSNISNPSDCTFTVKNSRVTLCTSSAICGQTVANDHLGTSSTGAAAVLGVSLQSALSIEICRRETEATRLATSKTH